MLWSQRGGANQAIVSFLLLRLRSATAGFLPLFWVYSSPGDLIKIQILSQQLGGLRFCVGICNRYLRDAKDVGTCTRSHCDKVLGSLLSLSFCLLGVPGVFSTKLGAQMH